MDKKDIRTYYKAKRKQLTSEDITILSQKILTQLISNFQFEEKTVHTFYSISNQKEIEMKSINKFLLTNTKTLATSITQFKPLQLIHSKVEKNTIFQTDKHNIPVPSSIIPIDIKTLDIVLVPLLAFDKQGNRIGYGKGLYDSFLINCRANCVKIGFSFFEHTKHNIPTEPHDIKLNYCITPTNIYSFNGN